MYLKFIRHPTLKGKLRKGSLYSVRFKPNLMGGYTEVLTLIGDAYEIIDRRTPLPLIYPIRLRKVAGRILLRYGMGAQRALLHVICNEAREEFINELRSILNKHQDVRIEIIENCRKGYGKN